MRILRSYLFVPGNRPDRFDKALAAGADAVIVDLEDAVPPAEKVLARRHVAGWLSPEHPVIVRVNAFDSEWFRDDLAVCGRAGVAGVVLPKAERVDHVEAIVDRVDGTTLRPDGMHFGTETNHDAEPIAARWLIDQLTARGRVPAPR